MRASDQEANMAQRKIWKPEEKLAIVMDGFRGRPVKDICREYGLSETQYYKWRDEALTLLKDGFQDKRRKAYRDNSLEAERNRLLKIIGEQQVLIDIQKKISVGL
jgi:transposase-like protein